MGRLNLIERRIEHFMRQPPSVRNAAGVIVVATAVVTVGAGALISLIDSDEYPNVGVGLWWANYPLERNFSNLPMPADSPFRSAWWYRTEFQPVSARPADRVWLRFNGIN